MSDLISLFSNLSLSSNPNFNPNFNLNYNNINYYNLIYASNQNGHLELYDSSNKPVTHIYVNFYYLILNDIHKCIDNHGFIMYSMKNGPIRKIYESNGIKITVDFTKLI